MFTAGTYRPTAPFMTPSAAYGLVLNIAGIESRHDDGQARMTLMRPGLPNVELALGALTRPTVQSLYQQLHNYPVGATGRERLKDSRGSKYNIQPVRREFLSGLDAYLCLRRNDTLEEQVRTGLREGVRSGPLAGQRYGVPFLGDNAFMVNVLREEPAPGPAYWYCRLGPETEGLREGRCRLTVWIDRADMTRTRTLLYAPTPEALTTIPEDAWTSIDPPTEGTVAAIATVTHRRAPRSGKPR
jgi:CRISPR-associated protein Cas5t